MATAFAVFTLETESRLRRVFRLWQVSRPTVWNRDGTNFWQKTRSKLPVVLLVDIDQKAAWMEFILEEELVWCETRHGEFFVFECENGYYGEPALYSFCKVSTYSNKLFEVLETHSSFRIQYRLLTMTTFFEISVYVWKIIIIWLLELRFLFVCFQSIIIIEFKYSSLSDLIYL